MVLLPPAARPPTSFRSSPRSGGFPKSGTNQSSPPAKTTPPLAPTLSSESIPRSRWRPVPRHPAPLRASPLQIPDAPVSAQNRSDSSRPAPCRAPRIPHPSRIAFRHSKTAQLSQFSSRCRRSAYSEIRRKQSETSARPRLSRPPSDAARPRQCPACAPHSSRSPLESPQTAPPEYFPDSVAPALPPPLRTDKPESDNASRSLLPHSAPSGRNLPWSHRQSE